MLRQYYIQIEKARNTTKRCWKTLFLENAKCFILNLDIRQLRRKREITLSLLRSRWNVNDLKWSLILYVYLDQGAWIEIYVRSKMTRKCRNRKIIFQKFKTYGEIIFFLKNVIAIQYYKVRANITSCMLVKHLKSWSLWHIFEDYINCKSHTKHIICSLCLKVVLKTTSKTKNNIQQRNYKITRRSSKPAER